MVPAESLSRIGQLPRVGGKYPLLVLLLERQDGPWYQRERRLAFESTDGADSAILPQLVRGRERREIVPVVLGMRVRVVGLSR